MKTIGLLGGMSWESSMEYYRIINEGTKELFGGLNSAEILMHSVNFKKIEELQHKGDWENLKKIMIKNAKNLEKGGADFILICTNTMHLMAEDITKNINIPLLHIADATGKEIKSMNVKKVALLGTKFTMEKDFYKKIIIEKYGIDVIIPSEEQRNIIHGIIYDELCLGKINKNSKKKYIEIIKDLEKRGAEGIILGCTEIGLLIKEKDCSIPIFDTTNIHAGYAVKYANNIDN